MSLVDAWVMFNAGEAKVLEVTVNERVPVASHLVQSVEGFLKLEYMVWSIGVDKPWRLAHVNVFINHCVKICITNVWVERS